MSTPTTLKQLKTLFTSTLNTLEPRFQMGSNSKFQPYERKSRPGNTLRRYTIRWQDIRSHEEGPMTCNGEIMEVDCFITVDYTGIPEPDIEEIVGDDHHLIEDTIQNIKSTGIGLYWFESDGYDISDNDTNEGDGSQYEHAYICRYKKAR